jgi:acetyl-CoA acyltransferase
MNEAVIVSAVRTPTGKAPRGALRTVRPETLAVTAIKAALERAPGLDPAEIDDIVWGCAFPEGEQGLNVGRYVGLMAGLPESVPGVTVNRFCSSGLQAIAFGSMAIMSGQAEVILAGGVESMSAVPGGGNKEMPCDEVAAAAADAYTSMGMTAENVAARYNVTREEQDAFAAQSQARALAAQANGTFDDELVPVEVVSRKPGPNGTIIETRSMFTADEGPRPGSTPEVLAKLRTIFKTDGSVTAGNSSQTSDAGAAAVLMTAEKAAELELEPLGVFRSFACYGVDPGVMGIGPAFAIPKALKLAGITIDDVDLVELNEAFASQAVYCVRELGLSQDIVNVNGGAIALGHPLGATGAKLTATLLHELKRRDGRYGVVSMCIAGGQGAAAVFERV